MASAAGLAPTSATTSTNTQNTTTVQNNGVARTSVRSTSVAKGSENSRKQSPTDTAARRPSAQKAWGAGTNPLTQRGSTATQSNGVATPSRPSNAAKMNTQKDNGLSDKHTHDRLTFIIAAATGLNVLLTAKNGEKYEGILAGSVLSQGNTKISLKMTKRISNMATASSNGIANREAALVGSSPDHAMNFDLRDMVDMTIPEFSAVEGTKLTNGTSSRFQTDVDISGNQNRGERTLQRWVPDGPDNTDFSLESGSTKEWDQFSTNRKLFGAESTYDESYYTTTIDRTAASYKSREATAAKLAREIETASSGNAHIREERGQANEHDGEDEEDKYSGVRRADQVFPPLPVGGANKYTPPARRAPTGQPTVPGAPVDSAIISAQLSNVEGTNLTSSNTKANKDEPSVNTAVKADNQKAGAPVPMQVPSPIPTPKNEVFDQAGTDRTPDISSSPMPSAAAEGPTEGVAVKVLQHFRQFADAEKQKLVEKKRAQASQDRTAKLNEFLRFSKTFKLKTPIPTDLVGILAKDPAKQEAIIEKAQKQHEESSSATVSPSTSTTPGASTRKSEVPQLPVASDRQTFNKGRGGYAQSGTRPIPSMPQQSSFQGRTPSIPTRPSGSQLDRKPSQPHPIPAPIPILDGRVPPSGPMADQVGLTDPQRSNMQTPTSAASAKFNLNVNASEFRPNATAPAFNPAASSNVPSSPASVQRTGSVSRAASPSVFFGARKPIPASERPSFSAAFNPVQKMRAEIAARKANEKSLKSEDGPKEQKNYSANGGIPNAFQTGPRWQVRNENAERTYIQAFERPNVPLTSPPQSRSSSTHHIPYQNQLPPLPTGPANMPQITTPQHHQPGAHHNFPHQYEDGHRGYQLQAGSPQVYPSPSVQSRQMSGYASPMAPHASLAYGQQPYFGAGGAQMQIPIRQYPGTPGMMHAQPGQLGAPMMMQQPSNGPYIPVPQYNAQMPMFSPNPGHVYPQPNGYGSPSRAPSMMQQGSQQGHHHGQPMMYTMSAQGGPAAYHQPGQANMMRGSFGGHQFANSPHQPYPLQQRTMSSGYGQIPQKAMPHQMSGGQGVPMNAPQQPAAYTQMEATQEEGK